eukprot:1156369-Pelagomonas_calceolata.AAC.7
MHARVDISKHICARAINSLLDVQYAHSRRGFPIVAVCLNICAMAECTKGRGKHGCVLACMFGGV